MSNVYEVTVRHSPCPAKRLQIEAANKVEALAKFVEANKAEAKSPRRTKSEPKLVSQVEAWAASGCPDVVVRLIEGKEPEEKAEKKVAKKGGLKPLPVEEADPTTLQE